jgi:hypothetical protein
VTASDCRSRTVELSAAGDRLRYRGPAAAADSALMVLLALHKPDLIRLLAGPVPGVRVSGGRPGPVPGLRAPEVRSVR